MDKRTGLTIIFLVVIFLGWSLLMQVLSPPQEKQSQSDLEKEVTKEETVEKKAEVVPEPLKNDLTLNDNIGLAKEFNQFDITFSNMGGVIRSVILKDNNGGRMEMIFRGEAAKTKEFPFAVHFGDYDAEAVNTIFDYTIDEAHNTIEFSRNFIYKEIPFTLIKTYILKPDEYVLEFHVTIKCDAADINLNFNGIMYTLSFGPQIGPAFEKLENIGEYRKFVYFDRGRNEIDLKPGVVQPVEKSTIIWAAIVGKYYTLIVMPEDIKRLVFDTREIGVDIPQRSALYIERPIEETPKIVDKYKIYIGPKQRSLLEKYNNEKDNSFGIKEKHLEEVVPSVFLIGAIADLLKYPLDFFFSFVRNYGIAIILLTIFIKILFYPLTRKSYESMRRLQDLNPKMTELRAKYKDNPKKLNMEMAELYRREGVNPLSGCLPQLIQLPIMFALYILLQEHFALRNAVFIPGWIDDLSIPEFIIEFNFSIPILNWQYLRLLPFIMLGTQILSSKLTQTDTGTDKKMKMLPYILVGVFFFVLYNLPSGLVLYWTVQNILTTAQMYFHKKYSKIIPPKPKKQNLANLKSYIRR